MNLYEKLSIVQSQLNAPKNQLNAFGNYKYRSCEDILTVVKPLLKQYHLSLVLSDNVVQIGNRFYVHAVARLHDTDNTYIENAAFARGKKRKRIGIDGKEDAKNERQVTF